MCRRACFGRVVAYHAQGDEPNDYYSGLVPVHDFDLTEVDTLAADIDGGDGLVVNTTLCFQLAFVGHFPRRAPWPASVLSGIDDVVKSKVAPAPLAGLNAMKTQSGMAI